MWQALKVLTKLPVSPGRRSSSHEDARALVSNERTVASAVDHSAAAAASDGDVDMADAKPTLKDTLKAQQPAAESASSSSSSKRLTRSAATLSYGIDDSAPSSDPADPSTSSAHRALGPATRVILCSTAPEDATWHRLPPVAKQQPEASTSKLPAERQAFRLLQDGAAFSRSRHAGSNTDTSDEYYHKLHRYPEMLEKRSARFERERLVHERAQLVLEIDALKSRGYAATKHPNAVLGKGELDRRKKLKQLEDRLRRYDVLLPDKAGPGLRTSGKSNPNSRASSPFASSSSQQQQQQQGSAVTKLRLKFGNDAPKRSHLSTSAAGADPPDGTEDEKENKKKTLKPSRLPDSFFTSAELRDEYAESPALQAKYAFGTAPVSAPSKEFALFASVTPTSWSSTSNGGGLVHRGLDKLKDESDDGAWIFTDVIANVDEHGVGEDGRVHDFAACKTFEDVLREKKGLLDDVVPESAIRALYDGPVKSRATR